MTKRLIDEIPNLRAIEAEVVRRGIYESDEGDKLSLMIERGFTALDPFTGYTQDLAQQAEDIAEAVGVQVAEVRSLYRVMEALIR